MSRASAIAAAVAGLAVFAAPAGASDVVHVKLGSTIQDLVVGSDGGAWVEIFRPDGTAIGRALPGGGFRTSGTDYASIGSTLGPDGQAWFNTSSHHYVRSDGAGNLTRVELPDGPRLNRLMATGPDGTLWNLTSTGGRFAHVTPQGAVTTYSATAVPKCANSDGPIFMGVERASDGAMWMIDQGCERLLRITSTGTSAVEGVQEVDVIAADAAGGMWFTAVAPSREVGHVDAAGTIKRFELEDAPATDVAVAPDGSAWFALDTCNLARVTPAGEVTTTPAPLPARQLGFDPAGGLWLSSHTRLVRLAPGEPAGPCDDRAPALRISPGRDGGAISLTALRRGLRLSVREPVVLDVSGSGFGDDGEDPLPGGRTLTRVMNRAGSFRFRVPATLLRGIARRLAAGDRPGIYMYVSVRDAEGVQNVTQITLRVRR